MTDTIDREIRENKPKKTEESVKRVDLTDGANNNQPNTIINIQS